MIENDSTQLTVFHCFAHCLLLGRAFASLYVLLFLEKEAEIGGRVLVLKAPAKIKTFDKFQKEQAHASSFQLTRYISIMF